MKMRKNGVTTQGFLKWIKEASHLSFSTSGGIGGEQLYPIWTFSKQGSLGK